MTCGVKNGRLAQKKAGRKRRERGVVVVVWTGPLLGARERLGRVVDEDVEARQRGQQVLAEPTGRRAMQWELSRIRHCGSVIYFV